MASKKPAKMGHNKNKQTGDRPLLGRYQIGGGFLQGYTVFDSENENEVIESGLGMWDAIDLRNKMGELSNA